MRLRPYYRIDPHEWLFQSNPDVAYAQRKALAGESDEKTLEEHVRQWVLKELLESYHYPREWIGERITVEEPVQIGSTSGEADIAIKNERGKPFLFIETKHAGKPEAEFAKDEGQLESYLSATHTASVGMITDSTPQRTKVIRKRIDPNEFDIIPDIPAYEQGELRQRAKLVREQPLSSLYGKKTGLKPISEKYVDILFQCHSAIRSIDNLHDDQCLDELCKCIYGKVYDERTTMEKGLGVTFAFQAYGGNVEEVASNIRDLYDEARKRDIEIYSQRIPNYARSRGVFKEEIKLSSAALFRVAELLQDYSFIDSNIDIKGQAFQQVLGVAIRAGMGQYFTPDQVVRMVVRMMEPKPHELVLDPFCGSGHFLTVALEHVRRTFTGLVDDYTLHQFAFFHLHGIDKDDRMVRIAMTDMLLHEDGHANIRNTDALLSFDNYPDIKALGGEENESPEVFNVVMTNPPFGALLTGEVIEILGRFELGKRRKTLPLEILGLERCIQFLKLGGRLAIVLPQSILNNAWMQFVREFILDTCWVNAVVSLPPQTFAPFKGVGKASVAFLTKKGRKEPSLEYEVFMSIAKHVGYDNTGRPDSLNDLPTIADDYEKFKGGEHRFSGRSFVVKATELIKWFAPEQFYIATNRANWQLKTLGELCDGRIFTGSTPARLKYTQEGKRILKVRNITNAGIDWKEADRAFASDDFHLAHRDAKIGYGDILFTASAHHPKYIGEKIDIVDYIPEKYGSEVLCTAELMVLRINPKKIDPYYVLLYLRSEAGYQAIQGCIRGQTAHIYPKDIKNIQIPVPPPEDREVVSSIIANLREALGKRREFENYLEKATTGFADYLGLVNT